LCLKKKPNFLKIIQKYVPLRWRNEAIWIWIARIRIDVVDGCCDPSDARAFHLTKIGSIESLNVVDFNDYIHARSHGVSRYGEQVRPRAGVDADAQ
jgi:hypothetical protein